MASASSYQFQLASYLKEWWDQQEFSYGTKVDRTTFASCLLKWMQADASCQEALKAFDEKVKEQAALSQLPSTTTPFIDLLVLQMDEDGDGFITQKELHMIHLLSLEAAKRLGASKPTQLMDFLKVLADHFKDHAPSSVKEQDEQDVKLLESLSVKDLMQSYDIKTKLSEYVWGTRDWIFNKLDNWIGRSDSRLLLLLAGPGMGKSVFSAVVHLKLKVLQDPKSKTILASQ